MPCLFLSGVAKVGAGPSKILLCLPLRLKDQDALIEQLYILIKQSVFQVFIEHNWLQWNITEA